MESSPPLPHGQSTASVHSLSEHRTGLEPIAQPVAPADGEIDLREIGRKLWRRKGIIIGTTLVLAVLAALVISQLTPLYTADAIVMIGDRQKQVVDVESVVAGLPGDAATIESEIQVIRSRGLAAKTIEELQLDQDPEFNRALRPPQTITLLLDPRTYLPEGWLGPKRGGRSALTKEEEATRQRSRIVGVFRRNLEVDTVGRSRVIRIAYTSKSPRTAARVANQLADFYIVAQLEAKFEATQRANEWLSMRLAELREAVEDSERAVEEFRRSSGLIQGEGTTLKAQEISELNSQLVTEQAKRAEAGARLRQVERLLSGPGGAQAVSQVLQSPLVQALREQQAEVERRAAELSVEFGEKHPKMINVRAEAADLRQKIAEEVDRIVQGLRNEVGVARVREATLNAALARLSEQVGQLNTDEVALRALEREAGANRSLLETFLARSKETSSQEDFQQADASIISRADVPEGASYPRKRLLLLVSLVGAGAVGLFLALCVEMLDRGFRSMEQIERQLAAAPLGLIPSSKGLGGLRRNIDSVVLDKPTSAYAEAIRSLYTGVLLSGEASRPRTLLVASALPKEGKTTVALSLARMLASSGHSVVLVDCDLRRPSSHKAFHVTSHPGLVECLLNKARLEDVLASDPKSRAKLVPAGMPVPNPVDLLGSSKMMGFLARLADSHEIVILDSPPALAVSDTRVLTRLADKTLFLVRWAHTRREFAAEAYRQLVNAGGNLAGVALTMVDVKRHAQYGYSDSGYYHGPVKKYYTG